jgi:hypothetical protein
MKSEIKAEAILSFMLTEILNIVRHETKKEAYSCFFMEARYPIYRKDFEGHDRAQLRAAIGILTTCGRVHVRRISMHR